MQKRESWLDADLDFFFELSAAGKMMNQPLLSADDEELVIT